MDSSISRPTEIKDNSPYNLNIIRFSNTKFIKISKFLVDLSIYNNVSKLNKYIIQTKLIDDNNIPLFFYAGKILKDTTELDCINKAIICISISADTNTIDNIQNDSVLSQMSLFNNLFSNIMPNFSNQSLPVNNLTNILSELLGNLPQTNSQQYIEQYNTMSSMGFNDEQRIYQSLTVTNGNLELAIEFYLNN